MLRSAFPILYVASVPRSLEFYEGVLGFEPGYRWPAEGEPGFVVLRIGESVIAIATSSAPAELLGIRVGSEPRFELCLYADDVDETVAMIAARDVPVLREPEEMPWGERMAYVVDPDGNPVQITQRREPRPT